MPLKCWEENKQIGMNKEMRLPVVPLGQQCLVTELGKNKPMLLQQHLLLKNEDGRMSIPGLRWEPWQSSHPRDTVGGIGSVGYGVARLPILQEKKGRHIGAGVTLYLRNNMKWNGIKMFQGKEACNGTPS